MHALETLPLITFWFDHLVIVIGCKIIVLNKSERGVVL